MAKSANNFYTVRDLEEKYLDLHQSRSSHKEGSAVIPPLDKGRLGGVSASVLYRAIRLSFMNAKYNSEVNFTFDKIESNISVINSIDELIKN